ncbi:MAG: cysteine hydrolase [Oscillospiraceae bacterium]|nr:cysteine hydrolase [Oscillospiraceae bacterium]
MQEDYIKRYNGGFLISNINMRIKQYLRNGDMIVYIQNIAKGKKSNLVNGLHVVSEFIFDKNRASCFTNHELKAFLKENNITDIELVGVDGNYCVGMSALDGVKHGYNIKLILECIGVINTNRFEKMKEKLLNAGVIFNYSV